jgi:hypothetical protein
MRVSLRGKAGQNKVPRVIGYQPLIASLLAYIRSMASSPSRPGDDSIDDQTVSS